MKALHLSLGLSLVVVSVSPALSQEARRSRTRGDGMIARLLHLMPPAFAEELNLDAEQQQKINGLETEFRKKRQEILVQTGVQVYSIIDKLGEEEDKREPAPVLAIAHEITGGLLQCRRLRAGYEQKMLALLNAQQREDFIDLKEQPIARRELRSRGEFWQPLSPRVERGLQLTEEQRRQLTDLRKQWESQFRNMLTEDQRERWERMARSARSPARAED
jgi:Spy/CpxP family protein refolding chaperone